MKDRRKFRIQGHLFFSNYFYGLCAVALSIEAMLQQQVPLNGFLYFFLVFIATVLYYTYPYLHRTTRKSTNPRINWYNEHYELMQWNQIVCTFILGIALALFLKEYWDDIQAMSFINWARALIFPAVAALYYGTNSLFGKYNLRKTGWLKPFVIGYIWAGMVTVYPVLFYAIVHRTHYELTQTGLLLFLKNFMFISILCILFDIKDYATDYIHHVSTFVVKLGLRKTLFNIVFPAALTGLILFVCYAISRNFNPVKVLLNALPYVLLAVVAWSLHKRRPLIYYLVIVDGLMLVKALCGSIAMIYF